MNNLFSDELRNDTTRLIIPVITAVTTTLALFFGIINSDQGFEQIWHLWLIVMLAPLLARLAWLFLKEQHQLLASSIFIVGYLLIMTLVFHYTGEPNSSIPYYFTILIVISGMISHPNSGFFTWMGSVLLLYASLVIGGRLTIENVMGLIPPLVVGLLLAIAVFLSAIEWQTAVESTSQLHRRAQERRDELFTVKEEITATNFRLQFLNKQIEEARQLALTERDLRTRFMNNLSHELRTPLNAIVNFAHILKLGGQGDISTGQDDYLGRIEKSGWHALAVLNDLLDIAQMESGEFKLNREVTHLQAVCEDTMKNLRGLLIDKEDVKIVRDYPKEWPKVNVDGMRMRQALLNLLGNAAKYTERGYIAMRVFVVRDQVKIVVEDTGIGIDQDHYQAIFQEFRQVDETAARKRIGTGLGLPITRHLIERHQGDIHVESELGKGSHFIISLPIILEEDAEKEPLNETISLTE